MRPGDHSVVSQVHAASRSIQKDVMFMNSRKIEEACPNRHLAPCCQQSYPGRADLHDHTLNRKEGAVFYFQSVSENSFLRYMLSGSADKSFGQIAPMRMGASYVNARTPRTSSSFWLFDFPLRSQTEQSNLPIRRNKHTVHLPL